MMVAVIAVDSFQPLVDHQAAPAMGDTVFAFQGDRLLLIDQGEALAVPSAGQLAGAVSVDEAFLIGELGGRRLFALGAGRGPEVPAGFALLGLRELFGRLDESLQGIAGRAYQLISWYADHAHCGRCGRPTHLVPGERARRCDHCDLSVYPRINPAVIMLVWRGDELLLARNRSWRNRGGFYSVLAGFVEPGESLEAAVVREVAEEVGLQVGKPEYFGSQPWPFPSQLMLAFFAEYAGGEIVLSDSELDDAAWFRAGHLPPLPGRFSIARRLIDDFLARHPAPAGKRA